MRLSRKQKSRQPIVRNSRVPLTYYRSGPAAGRGDSPFSRAVVKKKISSTVNKGLGLLLIIIFIISFIYSLLISAHPRVLANDTSYRSNIDYQEKVSAYFQSFANRNKLTYDETEIAKKVQESYPEVSLVKIELPLVGQTATVHLGIAKPALFLINSEGRFLIDSEGVTVGRADDFKGIKDLPRVEDRTGYHFKVGERALSQTSVEFVSVLTLQMKRSQVPVKQLILPPSPLEFDLTTTDQKYVTKFYLGGDLLLQTGQFLAARNSFSKQGQPAEYLDVRIQGKIFYK